ncbi:hypothetical protein P875_00064722 [Aspergillus parasiticus SU-1]|uniref:Uncharacterized protein n=3 Tax=Aspergillus subgen. Circumdati TaxID=2720871 RepID=A0A5N6E3E5_ASPPA|nr:hypothetical protein BDV34DRAFT_184604 [Aspergillus parasiticus]KAE8306947.1 hypothetical protein BDV41DRAFT_556628 [Aspergillus transmontanensis]KJK63828.1 hypothetical protein P875_00064722 [Aspergillus parasiticus SU-1]
MRFTTVFAMLAAAMGVVAEEAINIKICDGINEAGDCITANIYIQHQCYNLNGTPVSNNVRSFTIPSGYRCRFWSSTACNGGGTGDVQSPGSNENGHPQVNSVKCYAN